MFIGQLLDHSSIENPQTVCQIEQNRPINTQRPFGLGITFGLKRKQKVENILRTIYASYQTTPTSLASETDVCAQHPMNHHPSCSDLC